VKDATNLLPAVRRAALARRRRIQRWCWLGGIYAVIAGLAALLCLASLAMGGRPELDAALSEAARRVDHLDRQVQRERQALAVLREKLQANQAVVRQPDWSVLLTLIAEPLGPDVVLSRGNLRFTEPPPKPTVANPGQAGATEATGPPPPARFHLNLDGHGTSQDAVSRYALDLERIGLFDRVRLIETSRVQFLGREAVGFQIECEMVGESPTGDGA